MNRNIVHACSKTLYTDSWKSMIEVTVPGTAAQVLWRNDLHWPQTSSGQKVGLTVRYFQLQTFGCHGPPALALPPGGSALRRHGCCRRAPPIMTRKQ